MLYKNSPIKKARFIGFLLISILLIGGLIGCSKTPDIINNTVIYHYNTTIIREIEKTCPECKYDKSYVDGLRIEAKKCEENFTYLNLEDCEEDLDKMENRWDDCEEEIDEYREELDDCENELCDLNSSLC